MLKAKLYRQNHTKKHTHTHRKRKRKKENYCIYNKKRKRGFPGRAVVENLPANAGDTGSSPGLGRSHMPRSN